MASDPEHLDFVPTFVGKAERDSSASARYQKPVFVLASSIRKQYSIMLRLLH